MVYPHTVYPHSQHTLYPVMEGDHYHQPAQCIPELVAPVVGRPGQSGLCTGCEPVHYAPPALIPEEIGGALHDVAELVHVLGLRVLTEFLMGLMVPPLPVHDDWLPGVDSEGEEESAGGGEPSDAKEGERGKEGNDGEHLS